MRERGRHAGPAAGRPGERLVRAGALLFGVGVLGVLGVVVPFFVSGEAGGAVPSVLSVLAPLGLAVALLGLLRGARAR